MCVSFKVIDFSCLQVHDSGHHINGPGQTKHYLTNARIRIFTNVQMRTQSYNIIVYMYNSVFRLESHLYIIERHLFA